MLEGRGTRPWPDVSTQWRRADVTVTWRLDVCQGLVCGRPRPSRDPSSSPMALPRRGRLFSAGAGRRAAEPPRGQRLGTGHPASPPDKRRLEDGQSQTGGGPANRMSGPIRSVWTPMYASFVPWSLDLLWGRWLLAGCPESGQANVIYGYLNITAGLSDVLSWRHVHRIVFTPDWERTMIIDESFPTTVMEAYF